MNLYTSNGNMTFYTSATEKMRLTTSGNFGIKTTNPTAPMEINGDILIDDNSDGYSFLRVDRFGPAFNSGIKFATALTDEFMLEEDGDPGAFHISNGPGSQKYLSILASGKVGIGTSSPEQKLDVKGNIMGSAPDGTNKWRLDRITGSDPWVRLYQGSTGTYNSFAVGPFWANGASRFDIAEVTPVKEKDALEPGDVVCVDDDANVRLKRCQSAYNRMVAGIVSDHNTASMVIGGETPPQSIGSVKDKKPIALAGRVLCKVTDENGPVGIGDLLVTSNTPGYAMRGDAKNIEPGMVLGKAMEPLTSKKSKIVVWITN